MASSIYAVVVGKWWGVFLVWFTFGMGPLNTAWWTSVVGAIVLWLVGLPLAALLLVVTLPIELLLVAQERRLDRESIALADSSTGHHRPHAADTGNLGKSAVEDSIRAVFGGDAKPAESPLAHQRMDVLWRDRRYDRTPPVIAAARRGLVCADADVIRLLDFRSGDELWRVEHREGRRPHTIVPAGDDLLVYYRLDDIEDDIVARLTGTDGSVLWQRRQTRSSDPVAYGDAAVVVDDRFVMLVRPDGRLVWSRAPFHLGSRELATDGERIAALDLSNRVAMLDGNGEVRWRVRLDDEMRNPQFDDGRQRVKAHLGGRTTMLLNVCTGDGCVVVSGERGTIAFDADDGSVRWVARHGGGWTKPHIANGRVLITMPAEVIALDADNGQLTWRHEIEDDPVSAAASINGYGLVVGRRQLHRIALVDGERTSLSIGDAASPRDVDDAERAAKLVRSLRPCTSASGEVAVWAPEAGLTAIAL